MLFKLFDHAIDKHLPKCTKHSHNRHVQHKFVVLEQEGNYVDDLEKGAGIDNGDDGDPFVDLGHHLHWLGLIVRFDLSLEVRKESVGQ